jgi:mono/diheme cytochrome c family protein
MNQQLLVSAFTCEGDLLHGIGALRQRGWPIIEAFTPYPVHGLDRALGLRRSRLSAACFVFGLLGVSLALVFQFWTTGWSWPLNVGGQPWNSLPAFVPVTFEAMVLFAGLGLVFVWLVRCRLYPGKTPLVPMPQCTDDCFVLVLAEPATPAAQDELRALLVNHGATGLDPLPGVDVGRIANPSYSNLFLAIILAAMLALCWFTGRDVDRPNYESIIEGQMRQSAAYDAFAANPNFADGLTLRVAPAGTIARGQMPLAYRATPEDAVRAGLELRNPFSEKDERRQKRGAAVFANYCQVCHGPMGWGDGPITQGGFPPPPSLIADRALRMPEGQMFHVLSYGQGRMPPVASQLSREDRWCAILHVRQMQHFQVPSGKNVPFTLAEMAQLFRQNCVACHGEDGRGVVMRKALPNIPDFTDLAWQVAQTEIALVNQIDYGSLPLMPAFRYKLTRDQIVGLAVYVRSFPSRLAGRPGPVAFLKPVEVYQTYCFTCHGSTGRGDSFWRKLAPELPNFTSLGWQKSRTDVELAQSILAGKGKFMKSMSDKLGRANVQQMVALVREFKQGKVIPLATPKPVGARPPVTAIKEIKYIEDVFSLKDLKKAVPVPSGELEARIRMGGVTFSQFCILCHGEDGTGNIQRANLPPIPNFTDRVWQKTKQNAELLTSILYGKGTLMPAHSDRITNDQARSLVAYVRAFGPEKQTPAPIAESDFERRFRQLWRQSEELEKELQKWTNEPGGP